MSFKKDRIEDMDMVRGDTNQGGAFGASTYEAARAAEPNVSKRVYYWIQQKNEVAKSSPVEGAKAYFEMISAVATVSGVGGAARGVLNIAQSTLWEGVSNVIALLGAGLAANDFSTVLSGSSKTFIEQLGVDSKILKTTEMAVGGADVLVGLKDTITTAFKEVSSTEKNAQKLNTLMEGFKVTIATIDLLINISEEMKSPDTLQKDNVKPQMSEKNAQN